MILLLSLPGVLLPRLVANKEVFGQYPAVKPLLDDPRVHMHFDDGRRWLKRHPEETYDLLVMNSTFYI